MTIQITKTNEQPGEASLAVTVPADSVREAEERATKAWQARVRLPGFRKGKAPVAVVRKRYAEDIRQAAFEELVRESWRTALAQEQIKPIADPHIHNLKWTDGAPVTFEFHVEVRPEITLQRLGGFTLPRTVTPVTAEQVDAQLAELRTQRAPWVPVEGERPQVKDLVNVTLAQREGASIKDAQPYQLVLGEGRAIPDVEERIMSLLPGETVDAIVRFPDDFPEEAKRGQTRDVRITLHEVKRQHLAELSDDFAREVGDFESLDALRQAIHEDLEQDAQREDGEVKEAQPYQLVLGEGRAIPEVEEKIMALQPGGTVDATVRFPDDFAEEAKRGQTRDVRIALLEVKRQQLPELDDAFAREVGDFDSLDALRRAVREDLEKDAQREADAAVRSQLIQQIVDANQVGAPRPLVERALYVYAQAYGIPEDQWEKFSQEFHPLAEAQVRRDLVLDTVVEKQQLKATEAELDARIQELAARRGMPAGELYASLEKAKRLRDVERSITEEKVFAFLLSQSTVEQTT